MKASDKEAESVSLAMDLPEFKEERSGNIIQEDDNNFLKINDNEGLRHMNTTKSSNIYKNPAFVKKQLYFEH